MGFDGFAKRLKQTVQRDKKADAEPFAEDVGISRAAIYTYMKGSRLPEADVLAKICERGNVSADWLLLGRGDQTPGAGAAAEPEADAPYRQVPEAVEAARLVAHISPEYRTVALGALRGVCESLMGARASPEARRAEGGGFQDGTGTDVRREGATS